MTKHSWDCPIHLVILVENMKAYWQNAQESIATSEDLRRVVSLVRGLKEPTMLFLERDTHETLVLGLGYPESVLTFAEPDGTTFHSVGNTARTGRLRFWCRDQVDEFMEEMAVPEDVAVAAAFEFLLTGHRPTAISWEADW